MDPFRVFFLDCCHDCGSFPREPCTQCPSLDCCECCAGIFPQNSRECEAVEGERVPYVTVAGFDVRKLRDSLDWSKPAAVQASSQRLSRRNRSDESYVFWNLENFLDFSSIIIGQNTAAMPGRE